ncbi:MAG: hypothetical protein LBC18_13630 [Opitutaceae bacterium]|jgi:hypothetical protein|nr:hypothetical protein [Opitutaceae bacterium]
MPITTTPPPGVMERIRAKSLAPSPRNTFEWGLVPLAERERAFFSATVEDTRFLAIAKQAVEDIVGGNDYSASARAKLRAVLDAAGYQAAEEDEGGLKDLRSRQRLDLILKTNTEQLLGYAKWKRDNEDEYIDDWPCQELYRLESRAIPRNWQKRWTDAGGKLYGGGRMIARRDSPIWSAISRFGAPYPPFDFGSGMDVRDIDRDEAEALGIIKATEHLQPPPDNGPNASLAATAPDTPDVQQWIHSTFGDLAKVEDGHIVYQAQAFEDFYHQAVALSKTLRTMTPADQVTAMAPTFSLGQPTAQTVKMIQQAVGTDTTGWELVVDLQHVYHAARKHGQPDLMHPGSGEGSKKKGVALTLDDFRALPAIWHFPTKSKAGKQPSHFGKPNPSGGPSTFALSADILGDIWMGEFFLDVSAKKLGFGTAYKNK